MKETTPQEETEDVEECPQEAEDKEDCPQEAEDKEDCPICTDALPKISIEFVRLTCCGKGLFHPNLDMEIVIVDNLLKVETFSSLHLK